MRDGTERVSNLSTMELHCTLHTSMNPPLSFTYMYNRNKSRGFLEIVGHVVIGVRLSSMKAKSLSNQARRSGLSSISYSLPKLSVFCNIQIHNALQLTTYAKRTYGIHPLQPTAINIYFVQRTTTHILD